MRKAAYSLILAVLLAVNGALAAATAGLGWLMSFGLQALFFWAVFLQRKTLVEGLIGIATGPRAPGREGTLRLLALYYGAPALRAGRWQRGARVPAPRAPALRHASGGGSGSRRGGGRDGVGLAVDTPLQRARRRAGASEAAALDAAGPSERQAAGAASKRRRAQARGRLPRKSARSRAGGRPTCAVRRRARASRAAVAEARSPPSPRARVREDPRRAPAKTAPRRKAGARGATDRPRSRAPAGRRGREQPGGRPARRARAGGGPRRRPTGRGRALRKRGVPAERPRRKRSGQMNVGERTLADGGRRPRGVRGRDAGRDRDGDGDPRPEIGCLGGGARPTAPPATRAAAKRDPAGPPRLYQAAGRRFDIDWAFLASIGTQECGAASAPGSTPPAARGPMQIALRARKRLQPRRRRRRSGSTYSVDGDGDGRAEPNDLADAIFTAARILREVMRAPPTGGSYAAYRQAACNYYGACADGSSTTPTR